MSADPGVARRMGPWRGGGHNCVIVPAAVAAVCIINTCGYSGEQGL